DDHATRSCLMDPVTTTTVPTPMTNGVNLDFWSLIQQGALSTYPLLLCSVVVVAIALERAWSLRGVIAQAGALVGQIAPLLARGDFTGALGRLKGPTTPARRIYSDILTDPARDRVELERIA